MRRPGQRSSGDPKVDFCEQLDLAGFFIPEMLDHVLVWCSPTLSFILAPMVGNKLRHNSIYQDFAKKVSGLENRTWGIHSIPWCPWDEMSFQYFDNLPIEAQARFQKKSNLRTRYLFQSFKK